jgi:heme/copper-type cytochrome/quinol oxidase subunit 3
MRPPARSVPARNVDVSELPTFAFGPSGLIWWGTFGFMVIEAAMFVVVFVSYFYLRLRSDTWPPSQPHPDPTFATISLLVLLVSCIPNEAARRAAERMDRGRTRRWLNVTIVFGLAAIALRVFEYTALNVRWDTNAYGSILWVILSLHTMHLVTDVVDSVVLAVLAYTGPFEEMRFVDYNENALYWYFIVGSFVPVYLIVYFSGRWL